MYVTGGYNRLIMAELMMMTKSDFAYDDIMSLQIRTMLTRMMM